MDWKKQGKPIYFTEKEKLLATASTQTETTTEDANKAE